MLRSHMCAVKRHTCHICIVREITARAVFIVVFFLRKRKRMKNRGSVACRTNFGK